MISFEGVDTSGIDNLFNMFVNLAIVYMIVPGVIVGLVCKYIFRLGNKTTASLAAIVAVLGLVYYFYKL